MFSVYLRFAAVIILLLGIFYSLCYSFGGEVAVGIMCGLLLLDSYVSVLIDKMKGGK